MPIEPMEPESRISLTEIVLGIAAAIIVAPGVIWWIGTFIGILQSVNLVGAR